MACNWTQLDALLERIEQHLDLGHGVSVDERYHRSLAYMQVDRPPLVCQPVFGKRWKLPQPWNEFEHYSYRISFDTPAAMMQNMLLDRIVPALILKDDNPLAIRNDHGTIQIASLLGGSWELHDDNYPWVKPFTTMQAIHDFVDADPSIDFRKGVIQQSTQTLEFYHRKLAEYPKCKRAIQISLPDLQGPLDTADMLCGSEIFSLLVLEPDFVSHLFTRIVQTMQAAIDYYRKYTFDRLDPSANTQHVYAIPGRLMIRNDSAIMISPDTYRKTVAPQDATLLEKVGGGSIHFCGNGQHLVEAMLEIPHLRGLDFGQAEMMDINHIYRLARERKVAITCHKPTQEDLISGKARADFPTGVVFVHNTDTLEEAIHVMNHYSMRS